MYGQFTLIPVILTLTLLSAAPAFAEKDSTGTLKATQPRFTKLVWSDEFDYTGLPNPDKWGYETGYVRNKELQYYTKARLENARVQNGVLTITARKDNFFDGKTTHPITSAAVISQGKGAWQNGRIEVRAKVPAALGTWPAIWMLPANSKMYGGWPKSGEIDIMEHVGSNPKKIFFNIHTEKYNHSINTGKGTSITTETADTQFHLYALEWFDDRLDFYFDNQKVFSYENDGQGEASWPFNKPFYLLLNLAYGGSWGGAKGIDESALPQEYLIDYVRVWQK